MAVVHGIQAGVEAFARIAAARGFGIDGVVVDTDGRAPVERHWTPDLRRDVFSVSKTFTSVAIGLAEAEGLLELDDTVLSHLPEFASTAAPGVEKITVGQLLTMTSGIVYRWSDPDGDHPGDAAQHILATPLGAEPGIQFAYRGSSTYLLSRIIHACSGSDLRDYLLPRLFAPLGIRHPQWLRCPLGFSMGAVGLQLRTVEIARLGRTLLDGGRYDGQQVVPPDYVASMPSDSVAAEGHRPTGATELVHGARYGRHVWLCGRDDAWRMDGIFGQFSVILPRQRACVTVTAQYDGTTSDILEAIWSAIVPTLESR
jgi:Beta-lactamase class C and other penicillin binding proteins